MTSPRRPRRAPALALALAACGLLGLPACIWHKAGKTDDRKSGQGNAEDPAAAAAAAAAGGNASIKLKGTGLLAQSLYATLGPNKTVSDQVDDRGKREDLFETYGTNLGQTEGLKFGEIYPDSPSASYLLALTIIADNAARRCLDELSAPPAKTLCRCETADDARGMMARAFPFAGIDHGQHADLVERFRALCATDYVGAVSAMIASVGFASKQ